MGPNLGVVSLAQLALGLAASLLAAVAIGLARDDKGFVQSSVYVLYFKFECMCGRYGLGWCFEVSKSNVVSRRFANETHK